MGDRLGIPGVVDFCLFNGLKVTATTDNMSDLEMTKAANYNRSHLSLVDISLSPYFFTQNITLYMSK